MSPSEALVFVRIRGIIRDHIDDSGPPNVTRAVPEPDPFDASRGPAAGMDRRALLKRAAVAGAAAWTAPMIIDSLASPAAAGTGPIVLVQKAQNQNVGNTAPVTVTLASPATAGNLLIAAVNSRGPVVTPTGFTLAVSAILFQAAYIFYRVATGGETAVTFTSGIPAGGKACAFFEYGGLAESAVLDQVASNTTIIPTTTSFGTGTTPTTTQANELWFACGGPAQNGPFLNAASTFTLQTQGNAQDGPIPLYAALFTADQIVSATGTAAATFTWTTGSWCGFCVATFRGASSSDAGWSTVVVSAHRGRLAGCARRASRWGCPGTGRTCGGVATRAEGAAGLEDRSSRPHRSPDPDDAVAGAAHRGAAPPAGPRPGPHRRDRRAARLDGARGAGPPRPQPARPPGPADPRADPAHGDDPARRAGPRRHQEARPDPPRRRLAGPRPSGARRQHQPAKVGYAFVHSAVDAYTRLAYSEVLDDEQASPPPGSGTRAAVFFADHGIAVERVLTDNGPCYRSRRLRPPPSATAAHTCTRPYRPQTNGKVERFNRTLLAEWAYARPWTSDRPTHPRLDPLAPPYNHQRSGRRDAPS